MWVVFAGLCLCYVMLRKRMRLHLPNSGWRESVAGTLVTTHSSNNWESKDLLRTWPFWQHNHWWSGGQVKIFWGCIENSEVTWKDNKKKKRKRGLRVGLSIGIDAYGFLCGVNQILGVLKIKHDLICYAFSHYLLSGWYTGPVYGSILNWKCNTP